MLKKRVVSLLTATAVAITVFFPFAIADAAETREIHVTVGGSANGSGTENNPLNSIQAAVDKIPEMVVGGNQVKIYVHGGTYYADEPIVFTPEHSGTQGNPVLVQAYNNERVVLSGGRRISSWKEEGGGLVSAELNDFDSIGALSVNGKAAEEAADNTNEIVTQGYGTYSWCKTGIIANRADIPSGVTMEDGFVICYYKWEKHRLKTNGLTDYPADSSKVVIQLDAPYSVYVASIGLSALQRFYLSNDKALLDEPGEYFFDKEEKKLYYKLRNGESADSIAAYVGREEQLMRFEGNTASDKTANIIIDGISFANAAWKEAMSNGLAVNQSVRIKPISNSDTTGIRDYITLIPSAVTLNLASDITIRNCTFSNIDKTAVGLYDGVENCVIQGNTFSDIAASAISIGTPGHSEEDGGGRYNVAYKKNAWTENTYIQDFANYATDEDDLSSWSSEYTRPTEDFYIDLEKAYKITGVEIVSSKDKNNTTDRVKFRIDASNDIGFSDYVTLAEQGDTPFAADSSFYASYSGTGRYRYVRLVKTDGARMFLTKFRVFTDDANEQIKQTCKNNTISNNYITRVGTKYEGAAALHMFKVENTQVVHNYIKDVPYSAISLGWGWSVQPNSNTCKNNYIGFNRLEKVMQKRSDGGALYTLGNLGNTIAEYNYVTGGKGEPGGFYPDEGSNGMIIRYNVIEGVDEWLQIWTDSITNITASGNYYHSACRLHNDNPNHNTVTGNTKYKDSGNSDAVQADINNRIGAAGLEQAYQSLIYKVAQ